jgi:hypothetical protein
MNNYPQPGSRSRQRWKSTTMPSWLPLTLGALAGVALVLLGATLLAHRPVSAQPPSLDPTARRICADLTTQQYGDLYDLLSRAEQTIGSSDQFAASQRQLDAQLGTARDCAYHVTSQDAANATLALTLTRGTANATNPHVRLTVEQQTWRIADYDSSLVVAPVGQFSPNGG